MTVNPKDVSIGEFHQLMLGAVAPRPISLASTVDKDGNPNLSPFSFFNVFGANPPIAIFSPAKSGRTNTHKNTYENVKETMEVVINIVNFPIVQQVSLASTAYDKGVNEFIKSGLTPIASEMVKPARVKESPAQFECKVIQIIETGNDGGSGNLIIAEVVLMHVDEKLLDKDGKIDQHKIDLVGRMGGSYYVRASGDALFEVPKPIRQKGMGVDQLPEQIRNSKILSGNDLGMLGNVEKLPEPNEITNFQKNNDIPENWEEKQQMAHQLLEKAKVEQAWMVLLS